MYVQFIFLYAYYLHIETLSYQKISDLKGGSIDHPEVPRPGPRENCTLKSLPKMFGDGGPYTHQDPT